MIANKNIFAALLLLFFLSSCDDRTTFVSMPLVFEGSRLVISSYLSPDSIVKMYVTKTYPLDEVDTILSNYEVTDATVQLFEDSIFIENLVYQNQANYISPSSKKPIVGKSYYFVVNAPNFETTYNNPEKIPEKIPINSYIFNDSVGIYNSGIYNSDALEFNQTVSSLIFYVNDPPNKVNFYSFSTPLYGADLNEMPFDQRSDKIAGCELSGYPLSISDKCFNGLTVAFKTDMFPFQEGYNIHNYQGINITLQSLSENYYRFIQSREKYAALQDEIFAEPFNVYSNIQGGYGLVAAYNNYYQQINF